MEGVAVMDAACECENPYFGEFCDLCSGQEHCLDQTCSLNIECAACAVKLFDQFPTLNHATFFSNNSLDQLPNGAILTFDEASKTVQF